MKENFKDKREWVFYKMWKLEKERLRRQMIDEGKAEFSVQLRIRSGVASVGEGLKVLNQPDYFTPWNDEQIQKLIGQARCGSLKKANNYWFRKRKKCDICEEEENLSEYWKERC